MSNKTFTININKNHLKLSTYIFALLFLLGLAFWSRAAFVEPTFAPGDSDQDFAQNILGANNADNDFSSAAVGANNDGSIIERLEYFTDYMADRDRNNYIYGRGWIASSSGDASVALSHTTCEAASGWVWFEDGNGDGDTIDDEDGLCVATGTVTSLSWNGMDYPSWPDNTYLAAYTCSGSFPTGTVASYSGYTSGGAADNTWNAGDCALCQADCYDGRKDLPNQIGQDGAAYPGENDGATSHDGPLTPEVLKNWRGTRLPTFADFFGYCGASTGDADSTAGDSKYHDSGASGDKTLGNFGHNAGRGLSGAPNDEYLDLSNSSNYEWLSEMLSNNNAWAAGSIACSFSFYSLVDSGYRFRAVFRP